MTKINKSKFLHHFLCNPINPIIMKVRQIFDISQNVSKRVNTVTLDTS